MSDKRKLPSGVIIDLDHMTKVSIEKIVDTEIFVAYLTTAMGDKYTFHGQNALALKKWADTIPTLDV